MSTTEDNGILIEFNAEGLVLLVRTQMNYINNKNNKVAICLARDAVGTPKADSITANETKYLYDSFYTGRADDWTGIIIA